MNNFDLPHMGERMISIHWTPRDVKDVFPSLTNEQCYNLLAKAASRIEDLMIDKGWDLFMDFLMWEADYETRQMMRNDLTNNTGVTE